MRRSSALSVASLEKWHRALSKLDLVTPVVSHRRFLAWKGDKVLGSVAARVVTRATGIQDCGNATRLVNYALSNRYFAENITIFLSAEIIDLNTDAARGNDHHWGTVLESVVALVDQQGTPESDEALVELAEWLLKTAFIRGDIADRKGGRASLVGIPNAATTLVKRGGTLTCKMNANSPQKDVTAEWNGVKSVASGVGKKQVLENQAASDVLRKALLTETPDATTTRLLDDIPNAATKLVKRGGTVTRKMNARSRHKKMSLRNGTV
jgi:hypothetical protein